MGHMHPIVIKTLSETGKVAGSADRAAQLKDNGEFQWIQH